MKKREVNNLKREKRIELIVMLIIIILILNLQVLGNYGRTTFLQDHTIVFEGGYRTSLGQVPYKDFSLPMGPGVFLMQAFFNLIFGSTFFAMLIHAFILSVILSLLFFKISKRLGFNNWTSFIFSIFLYISFSGLTFHPFYNHTPYFFFVVSIIIFLYFIDKKTIPNKILIGLAVLSFLSFYTKQDTGLLQTFFTILYLFYNYRKDWKKITIYHLIPVLILIIGTFLLLSIFLPGFSYWFNLGQAPHGSRLSKLLDSNKILTVLSSFHFYFSLLFIYLILFKKIKYKRVIKIMSLFIAFSITHLITNITSGSTRQLSVMCLVVPIFLIALLIKESSPHLYNKNKFITNSIIIILLLLILNPFATWGLITLNYFDKDISRIDQGCYKGFPMSSVSTEGLKRIREIIEINDNNFVNIGEYSFLYCDYGLTPPKGLPIWFDHGISFFDENIPEIMNIIDDVNPNVILIQDPHGHEDPNLNQKFITEFENRGYVIVDQVEGGLSRLLGSNQGSKIITIMQKE